MHNLRRGVLDNNKIWEGFTSSMKANLTPVSFNTWICPLSLRKLDKETGIIYIETEQELVVNWIKDNYFPLIQKTFDNILGMSVNGSPYRIVIKTSADYIEHKTSPSKKIGEKQKPTEKLFNPRYNFENFIVGKSNMYAYAASVAVAESPGEAFNPLFIYGGSGLGKTHLMQAIGVHISTINPSLNVLYVSSEMFMDEFIKALADKSAKKFENKFRKVDVLLIDDIQFLEGKESTQEEFFYTFEHLYSNNKQIVITADCPPSSLNGIEDRLRSRFSWNMIANIQPPDYETRVAILKNLAEKQNLNLTDETYQVCCLIAEQITDNIRELEGAFNRVVGFSNLLGEPITVDYAKTVLKDIISNTEQAVAPERIRSTVASYYKIKLDDIDSPKRNAEIALPRQVAMYLCRENTDVSLAKIGKLFGNRHYATVIHAVDKINEMLKYDEKLANDIATINSKLTMKNK